MILDHSKLHQKYFEEMTQIPHGSFNEKAYSDYLVQFAISHKLDYLQDDHNDVIIYKPASKGYEDHKPVLLQGHMDMVCEKNKDVEFDFSKDSLQLEIKDGFLMAKGTTLGADDGCGVAYMLAILADDSLAHPPLECCFTVQEEVGLFGALAMKAEYFKARRMINLDDGGETISCMSSAGGLRVNISKAIKKTSLETSGYSIEVKGLHGGHSGEDINKERGNANRILARLLNNLDDVRIADIAGGDKDNAIPREAKAIVASKEIDKVNVLFEQIKKEYEGSDEGLSLNIQEVMISEALSNEDSKNLIHLMLLLPNGLYHHSMQIKGLSSASANLASVHLVDEQIKITASLRGALASYIEDLQNQITLLCELYTCDVNYSAGYPAWNYDAKSELREVMKKVCLEIYNKELTLIAVHGGLECGVFKSLIPDMEIATMGPIMYDIHTPKERLDLASFDRTFNFLTAILANL